MDAPSISVNGKIIPPVACMTYHPNVRTYRSFQEADTPFASVGAYAPDRGINDFAGIKPFGPAFWVGEGKYDFTEIDRTFATIAPSGNEVFIFPRVYLDSPSWWEKEHPAELCMDERGATERESFASDIWRKDAANALLALIDHINHSIWKECVIGYQIACGSTEEWTYHHYSDDQFRLDYSEPNRIKYIGWLKNKYKTAEALCTSWKQNISSFDAVTFPTLLERCYCQNGVIRDFNREQKVIDFWNYTSWLFADTIDYLCKTVKDASDGNLITGAFYGYLAWLARSEKGHYATRELLRSPNIDFFAATLFGSVTDSLKLHGKFYFQEGDVRTCLTRPFKNTLPQAAPNSDYFERYYWKPLPNMDASLTAIKRYCARVLTSYMGVWWCDMFGGWFDASEMMDLFGRFNKWMRERKGTPLKSEIAVIIDEKGLSYLPRNDSPALQTIMEQRSALEALGAPYDIYEAGDLAEDTFPVDQYKLYILFDFINPDADISDAVRQKLRKNGRTLFWGHLSNASLSGFSISYDRFSDAKQGVYEKTLFPSTPVSCPRFIKEDITGLYPLAVFNDSMEPCVCAKQSDSFCDIYSLLPNLPENLLRQIARLAGVHLYTYRGDYIYAGGNYVAICSRTAGNKRIHLPCPIKRLVDVETGKDAELFDSVYTDFQMEENEVRIFKVEIENE